MTRTLISSGSPYEGRFGFSRAVRVGRSISVAGTAAIAPDGSAACPGDPVGQMERCLGIVAEALQQAGATMEHVVRTRVMLKDVRCWEQVAAVHGRVFAQVRPACTVVEVKGFIDPGWLVEVEADALLPE